MDLNTLDSYRNNPNVQKMLATLQAAEGVRHGYNTGFGNTRFDSLADHPRERKPFKNTRGETQYTTAAGAYQFLSGTWDDFRNSVAGVTDFGESNQDRGAIWLMNRAGALADVAAGNWDAALPKLAPVWASLPDSPYPQKTRSKDFIYRSLTGGEQIGTPIAQLADDSAPVPARDADYPMLPTARSNRGAKTDAVGQALLEVGAAQSAAVAGSATGDQIGQTLWDDLVREQRLRDSTTIGNLWDAYQGDPRVMSQIALMDRLTQESEVVPAGWNYMDHREEIEKAWIHNPDAIEYLRENVRGPESMQRAHAQLLYRQDLDLQYGRRGGLANFMVGAGSSMTDIPGFIAGLGVAKAFQVAKIGHAALAAKGRPYAATGAFLAEAAAGNVAVEGLLDYLGEVKTAGDYGFAALTGAAMTAPFARGVYVDAHNRSIELATEKFNRDYVADQKLKVEQVQQTNPNLTPAQVAAKVEADEIANIRKADIAARNSSFNQRVVPEDVDTAIRNGEDLNPIEPETSQADPVPETAPPTPPVAPPPTPAVATQATLPRELAQTKTNYSYGSKRFEVQFESDIDRAAYVVAGKGKSKSHQKYVSFLESQGISEADARVRGQELRDRIKAEAANSEPGTIRISATQAEAGAASGASPYTYMVDEESGTVIAYHGLDEVGSMSFEETGTGTMNVSDMGVEEGHRRRGVATAMLSRAQEVYGDRISFSNSILTRDGLEFARNSSVSSTLSADQLAGNNPTIRDMLESIRAGTYFNKSPEAVTAEAAGVLLDVLPGLRSALDEPMLLGDAGTRASFDTRTGRVTITSDTPAWVAIHEATHAATVGAYRMGKAGELGAEVQAAAARIDDILALMRERRPEWEGAPDTDRVSYGLRSGEEFMAQAMSDPQFQAFLNSQEIPTAGGSIASVWQEFIRAVANLLGVEVRPGYALHETLTQLDKIMRQPAETLDSPDVLNAPRQVSPDVIAAAERKWISRILTNARDTMQANPIDTRRLDVLLRRFSATKDLVSDGLRMAASKSPLMQLMSRTVVETTTGAAGRGNTAAIAVPQIQNHIMGNFLPEVDGYFRVWANQQGYGVLEQGLKSGPTQQFNRLVFDEIHGRRTNGGQPISDNQSVVAAADAVQKMADRARMTMVRERVAGSQHLPQDSIGYLPQSLDGAKLSQAAAENPRALAALRNVLSKRFQETFSWSKEKGDELALRYTQRQMERTKGYVQHDSVAAGGDGTGVLRDVLEDMSEGQAISVLDELSTTRSVAQNNLKRRLDVDMFEDLGVDGLTVADFYIQDYKSLMRSYAHRTAGNVALTRHGVPGSRGVRLLEKALAEDPMATTDDLTVFRRVMSGILGTPYAGRVVSQGAANLGGLVNMQRMGSLVFNQMVEPVNVLFQLGVRSFLSAMVNFPKAVVDVAKLKRGEDVSGNLRFLEKYAGSDIGMDGYRMVAPLDPTDAQLNVYSDNPGIITRLVRAGGHLQSKVTFFRRLMAAQHRAVAEQVMMKALRYAKEPSAKTDKYLADMGFTPELLDILRKELPGIARWDSNGNLADFDLTMLSDPGAAQAFVNAVHRGTSQLIQDTYVGEQNAIVHNDYLRALTQFRSYSLTAMEKQWARTRMNTNAVTAGAMLLGQAAAGFMMHVARVHSMSIGREDREDYIERAMTPAAVAASVMNYASLSGMLSDVVQGAMFMSGWDEDLQQALGARTGSSSMGSIVPAFGSVEAAMRVVGGKADLYTALKQLPGSNIWYLVPIVNLTKE